MTSDSELMWKRLGVITKLVEKLEGAKPGRTAIMKLLYFLKTLKGVALSYDFRLYTYGPFDSNVLDDLNYSEALGYTNSSVVHFSSGYGYEVEPGENAENVLEKVSDFLQENDEAMDWVVENFGRKSASELELFSTIIFVDREISAKGESTTVEEIAKIVHEVKPHFSNEKIQPKVEHLKSEKLLLSIG